MYYPINEDAARAAKNANSFYDYVEGSATADYRRMVDRAAEIAERQRGRVGEEYHARIESLLASYAKKLADNLNRRYEIDARCPSVLVAGPANFPIRKKEKQNAAREANEAEYLEIQGLLDKIKSVGMGGIMSDDKNALAKLEDKLAKLEALQTKMRLVNAYVRKHKTLDGCEIDDETRRKLDAGMIGYPGELPYPAWALTNNRANIRRVKARIAELEKEKQVEAENAKSEPIKGEGYTVRENTEIGRIQLVFDGKPDERVRAMLKAHGFRWAPSEGAWQRMLNDNGRRAAQEVVREL